MNASELERMEFVLAGGTVIANLKSDKALIAWAKKHGKFVRIDRRSPWGNPFVIGKDGDREEVIAKFRDYCLQSDELLMQCDQFRGKVLACWCHPERCHGEILIELMETAERDASIELNAHS